MKKTIKLKDLTCPSCVIKIEQALQQLPGVENVNVRFNSSKVDVEFHEALIQEDAINKRLFNIGFEPK